MYITTTDQLPAIAWCTRHNLLMIKARKANSFLVVPRFGLLYKEDLSPQYNWNIALKLC